MNTEGNKTVIEGHFFKPNNANSAFGLKLKNFWQPGPMLSYEKHGRINSHRLSGGNDGTVQKYRTLPVLVLGSSRTDRVSFVVR